MITIIISIILATLITKSLKTKTKGQEENAEGILGDTSKLPDIIN